MSSSDRSRESARQTTSGPHPVPSAAPLRNTAYWSATRARAGTLSFVTGNGSRRCTARSLRASMSASAGTSAMPGLGTVPWHAPQNANVSLGHGEKPKGIWRTGLNMREPTDPRPMHYYRAALSGEAIPTHSPRAGASCVALAIRERPAPRKSLQRQAVDVRLRDDVAVLVEQHHHAVDRDARQEADDARIGEHEVRERECTGSIAEVERVSRRRRHGPEHHREEVVLDAEGPAEAA